MPEWDLEAAGYYTDMGEGQSFMHDYGAPCTHTDGQGHVISCSAAEELARKVTNQVRAQDIESLESARTHEIRPTLTDALGIACALSEPSESNREYIRGQAELLCDLYGLNMDDSRSTIMKIISFGHLDG